MYTYQSGTPSIVVVIALSSGVSNIAENAHPSLVASKPGGKGSFCSTLVKQVLKPVTISASLNFAGTTSRTIH